MPLLQFETFLTPIPRAT